MKVNAAGLSSDGLTLKLDTGALKQGYLHKIALTGLRTRGGQSLLGGTAWYKAVKVPTK